MYVVGRKEWFKNENEGDEREECPRGTKDHLEEKLW